MMDRRLGRRWSVSCMCRMVKTALTVATIFLLLHCFCRLLLLWTISCPPTAPQQRSVSPLHSNVKSRGYTAPGCRCIRFGYDIESLKAARQEALRSPWKQPDWLLGRYPADFTSTCSDYSTQRGAGQKVVSYSHYEPGNATEIGSSNYKKFLMQLYPRARSVLTEFPGWIMRVYHNVSLDDTVAMEYICKLFCQLDHVDLCNVNDLPRLGNLGARMPVGRTWRFAVMGDPTVTTFLSRDSDSVILEREVVAVKEWLQSARGYHVMRDHPHHKACILAGLFGAHNKYPENLARVRDDMFSQPVNLSEKYDQALLASKLWPLMQNDVLQHDSYNCDLHPGSIPFSTERREWKYCGWGPYKSRERNMVYLQRCPKACRPPDHPQWVWC